MDGRPLLTTQRLVVESAAVCLACLALAVLRLPALWLDPAGAFWGRANADAIEIAWTLWHVARSLVEDGDLGVQTGMIGFPVGGRFMPTTPLEAVLLAPVTLGLGPLVAYNLLQLLHVALAGAATYALARRLTGSAAAALAVTPVVAFSSMLLATCRNGNAEVGQVFWIPLGGLFAWDLGSHPRAGPAVGLGLVLAAALVGSVYVGIGCAVVVAGLAWAARPPPGARRRWLGATLGACALGAALAGPVLLYAHSLTAAQDSLVLRSPELVLHMRLLEGAAHLAGFVTPGVVRAADATGGEGAFLNGWAIGWIASALALSALLRPHRLRGPLAAVALAGVLLALGPVLSVGQRALVLGGRHVPLPYVFLDRFPPFSLLVELWRFSVVVQVAVAVLAAWRLRAWRHRYALAAGAAMLLEALLLTPGPAAWEVDHVSDEPMAALFQGQDGGAVLHFPVRQVQWPLYYQTQHGRPVATSLSQATDPVIQGLVTRPGWSLARLHEACRARGYRWLVVHTRPGMDTLQDLPAIVGDLERAGLVTRRLDNLVLVDLQQPGPWPARGYDQPAAR